MDKQKGAQPKEIKKTSIGGQALIEGLMMIGPTKKAMAVLMPNGEIVLHDLGANDTTKSNNIPFLRGAVRIFNQMSVGTKALLMSAELQEEAEEAAQEAAVTEKTTEPEITTESEKTAEFVDADEKLEIVESSEITETANVVKANAASATTEVPDVKMQSMPAKAKKEKGLDIVVLLSVFLGLGLGIALFILLPNLLTSGLIALTGVARTGFSNTLIYNLVEGVIRIAILLFYMWLSSKQEDIKRVWMFHGAEHKTIACYEAERELTVDNVRQFSRFHPRCGTSFLFILVFISALVFALVGWYGLWINMLLRLALIPLVAGLAYEILRYSGKHSDTAMGRALAKPGLLLQRLTTKEPDDTMLAVAIQAMNAVIPEDESADRWA